MGKRELSRGWVSQRGTGLGRCGIRRNRSQDPSGHVGHRKDSDHTTIYPPDRLGLPPSAWITKKHAPLCCAAAYINKYARAPPPLSQTQRTGTSSRTYPRSFLPARPPLTLVMHSGHSTFSARSCSPSSNPLGTILFPQGCFLSSPKRRGAPCPPTCPP